MSDYDDDGNPIEDAEPKRNWRRDLEDKAREAETAKAEAEAAKRELAFAKAGIDVDTPSGRLFAKAYDGANTLDAVKAAALEYGVLEAPAPQVPAEELAALDRVSQASAGATTASEEHDLTAELDKATTPDEVLAVFQKAQIAIDTTKPGNWMRPSGTTPL